MVVPLMPADPAATVAAAGLSRTARRPERSKVRRPTACQAIARGFFEPMKPEPWRLGSLTGVPSTGCTDGAGDQPDGEEMDW